MRRWIGALLAAGIVASAAAGADEPAGPESKGSGEAAKGAKAAQAAQEEPEEPAQEPMGSGSSKPAKPRPSTGGAAAPAPAPGRAPPGASAVPTSPATSPAPGGRSPGAASSSPPASIPRSPWGAPPASSLRGATTTAAPRPALPEAVEAPPVATGWTGQRWQYHVEMLVWEEYRELPEYQQLERELGGAFRATFEFQERVLERAGQQGWELAELRVPKESSPATVVLYMKRLLPPAPPGTAPAAAPPQGSWSSGATTTPTGGVPPATGWTSPGDPTAPPRR